MHEPRMPDYDDVYEAFDKYSDRFGYDFVACLWYNSIPEFTLENVRHVTIYVEGWRDGDPWEWIVQLKNGSTYVLEGGCDYTGWD